LRKVILAVSLILVLAVSGCAANPDNMDAGNPQKAEVTLWVTEDFGSEVLFQEKVPLEEDDTVLDVLARHVDVETEYGGGFVNAINGLQSAYSNVGGAGRRKNDWFFWLNGIQSNVGGASYYPKPGDNIWWDYHDWQHLTYMPAVIGAYPKPFTSGFGEEEADMPWLIMHNGDTKVLALKLAGYFGNQGAKVDLVPVDDSHILDRERPTLVMGTWSQLALLPSMNDLVKNLDRTGMFVKPVPDGLVAMGLDRTERKVYGSGSAAIIATGTGQGDQTPLWMVIGVDQEGLERAVRLMTEEPERLKFRTGLIVTADKLLPVPIGE